MLPTLIFAVIAIFIIAIICFSKKKPCTCEHCACEEESIPLTPPYLPPVTEILEEPIVINSEIVNLTAQVAAQLPPEEIKSEPIKPKAPRARKQVKKVPPKIS